MGRAASVLLPENLTIACVENLYSELDKHINTNRDVAINGEAVGRADTAGLQLLAAFIQTMERNHAKVTWKSASEPLRDACEKLGLKSLISI